MDTNCCDALKYLLSTWMITEEITNASDFTNLSLRYAFSLNMVGGATFDVSMQFLH